VACLTIMVDLPPPNLPGTVAFEIRCGAAAKFRAYRPGSWRPSTEDPSL
jgi:hypothetical protein